LLTVPVLVLSPPADAKAQKLCTGIARCEYVAAGPGKVPLHLAPDSARDLWRQALLRFVAARVAEHAHGV
jgi:hypothetical protein